MIYHSEQVVSDDEFTQLAVHHTRRKTVVGDEKVGCWFYYYILLLETDTTVQPDALLLMKLSFEMLDLHTLVKNNPERPHVSFPKLFPIEASCKSRVQSDVQRDLIGYLTGLSGSAWAHLCLMSSQVPLI